MLHTHQDEHAFRAYARTAKTGLTGKRLIAAVLSQCATDMQRALEAADPEAQTALVVETLERNRRAWSAIAEELGDPDSHIDETIRQALARIAAFTFRETFEICQAPAAERLRPLIEMNRELASAFEANAA